MHLALLDLFAKYRILEPVLDAAAKKAICREVKRGASTLLRCVLSTIGRSDEEMDNAPHYPELKGDRTLLRRQPSKTPEDAA